VNVRGHAAAVRIAIAGVLLLGGCAQVARPPARPGVTSPIPPSLPVYEIAQGRDAALVARLRAAPPVAQPQVTDGATPDGDERLMRARGLVLIGIGHYPADDIAAVREQAQSKARSVGADQALIYPPQAAGAPALALFFVRLQLPFGANFRDLTDVERKTLGVQGVEIGEVVGGTPASEANLREGDYVLKFDRQPVRDKAAFQALLQSHLGRRVILTIRRNGVTTNRLVLLGTLPPAPMH
jgi:membrane-associated protease RseP (regulator of RpoE activity)